MTRGYLTLIPTPIDDDSPLCSIAYSKLESAVANNDLILVEEHKVARRRWLKYGLPREAIDQFILYNEHTFSEIGPEILNQIKNGKNAYLMSDCGLPAFCDPGRLLVDSCHNSKIKVTSTPFANSIALAVSLSGFEHERFVFEGFIPSKSSDRTQTLKRIINSKEMSVIMDTPYRLSKLMTELKDLNIERDLFLGMNLNQKEEKLLRGSISEIMSQMDDQKREFILIMRKKL